MTKIKILVTAIFLAVIVTAALKVCDFTAAIGALMCVIVGVFLNEMWRLKA